MLFDLRSRGRRTTVKVVYSMLAVLMGAGLILFGIGGATSGGFLNGLTGNGGGGGGTSPAATQKHLEQIVRRDPHNAKAWARLVTVRYGIATSGGPGTSPSKAQLQGVDDAWTRYLALNPPKPSDELALTMEGVYGPGGLNEPAKFVTAVEAHLAATKKPTASDYELYSVVATQASQTRKAALAKQQAQDLAAAGKTGAARKKAIAKVKTDIAQNLAALQQAGSTTAQTTAG